MSKSRKTSAVAATGKNADSLRGRFSPQAMARVQPLIEDHRRKDPGQRRTSYKGTRARYHLRLPEALVHDLALISFLTGGAQNDYCQKVLSSAVQESLQALKSEMDPAHWNILTDTFERQRQR